MMENKKIRLFERILELAYPHFMQRLWACRIWKFWAVMVIILVGCANSPDRLPPLSRKFYYNLPSSTDQQAFLKLKEAQRQEFLERKGLWEKWAALPQTERDAALREEVKVGFHEFAAFMAWGPPADKQGQAPKVYTFIRCTSGPKVGKYVANNLECDGTSSEKKISVDDGIIVEIKFLN